MRDVVVTTSSARPRPGFVRGALNSHKIAVMAIGGLSFESDGTSKFYTGQTVYVINSRIKVNAQGRSEFKHKVYRKKISKIRAQTDGKAFSFSVRILRI